MKRLKVDRKESYELWDRMSLECFECGAINSDTYYGIEFGKRKVKVFICEHCLTTKLNKACNVNMECAK